MLDTTKQLTKVTYEQQSFILPKGGATEGGDCSDIITGTITELTADRLLNVATIRVSAFENVTSLQKVSIPSNVITIGDNAFNGCTGITELSLAEGVQTIGANAFNGVSATFEIPRSLVNVGEGAFANNTAITSMTIPSTLTTLSANMFNGCTNLTEITMESTTPPSVTSTTFPANVTSIYVPYGAYDSYKTSWSSYASKIVRLPAIPSTITVTVNDYNGELVSGASVTITGNGQTYTGTTNESGVFTQGDLQPATYTISVADLEGYKTPASQDVVVEENTQNSVTITYLEKPSVNPVFGQNTPEVIMQVANEIATKGMTSTEVEATYGWKIGDTIIISSSSSTVQYPEFRIIGFNHDDLSSGLGKAGITLEMTHCVDSKRSVTRAGYEADSNANKFSFFVNPITIPGFVRVEVLKNYVNGGGTNYTETTTQAVKSFSLSAVEMFGTTTTTDGANEGTQYEYYKKNTSSSKKVKKLGRWGSNIAYWLRSTPLESTTSYSSVSTSGVLGSTTTSVTQGLSVAFCIGSPQPSRTFSENSPAMISKVSNAISSKNMTSSQVAETFGWNIGDTISYDLTTGENVEMRIVGFNHDDKSDGTGKAGITLEMTHCLATICPMNDTDTNAGGYPASVLKTTTLPAIKATVPQEWQNVIKLVDKKSANGGSSNYSETITLSEDLFLLSSIEVGSSTSYAQDGKNEGTRYEYWNDKKDADRIKKRDKDGDGVPEGTTNWWLRSCRENIFGFVIIGSTGGVVNFNTNSLMSVSYAFCI